MSSPTESPEPAPPGLRIGELGRRLGVSEHVLRAWERRYGVLRPARTAGGYRLYSPDDEDRVRRMQAHLARGLAPAEAAGAALREKEKEAPAAGARVGGARHPGAPHPGAPHPGALAGAARALGEGLDQFDEPAAQAVLDRLFDQYSVEVVLRDVIIPYLHDLGERWARGTASVGSEHLATNLLRGRLAGLAQGWGSGTGPRAVLACVPGEQHDLALIAFGIVLHRNGWRVEYLGADTPIEDVAHTAAAASADLAVLAVAMSGRLDPVTADLARLAATVPLALAGAGATRAAADLAGARLLAADPVTEAEMMPAPPV